MLNTEELSTLLNEKLNTWLQAQPKNLLQEAKAYSLLAGGKQVRGKLCLQGYQIFKDDAATNDALHNFALAIEFLHTYTLVQDDSPSMDNDQYRRGKLATHAKFGEAAALLASDGLHSSAVELTLVAATDENLKTVVACQKILFKTIGSEGTLYGQWLDLSCEGRIEDPVVKDLSLEEKQAMLKKIHRLKTGVLIEASVVIGATLAGATEEQIASLKTYGDNLGICFQITDDLLDETGT
ncbi:MAG: polyprenyl synthetase family protein, partial [Pseudomonadales bacterium]|nr:polyprenyl synthetase family protein [Pseudomonadales bacterium]